MVVSLTERTELLLVVHRDSVCRQTGNNYKIGQEERDEAQRFLQWCRVMTWKAFTSFLGLQFSLWPLTQLGAFLEPLPLSINTDHDQECDLSASYQIVLLLPSQEIFRADDNE